MRIFLTKLKQKSVKNEACLSTYPVHFGFFNFFFIIFPDFYFLHLPQDISLQREKTRKGFGTCDIGSRHLCFSSFSIFRATGTAAWRWRFKVRIQSTICRRTSNKSLLLFFVIFHFFKVFFFIFFSQKLLAVKIFKFYIAHTHKNTTKCHHICPLTITKFVANHQRENIF